MENGSAFKIVIAYEDLAAGVRAREMSERLAAELKPEIEINNDVWKFELLSHPQLREYAVADAVEADMVILSARGETELPGHVRIWIERWLSQKRPRPVGLVALLDVEDDTPGSPPPGCAELRQMAAQARMDFFCKAGNWQRQDFEYVIDTVRHRSESRTVVLEEMLHQELRSCFRWLRKGGYPPACRDLAFRGRVPAHRAS